MLPSTHFIAALIISIFLIVLGLQWWQLALFFFATVFIDVDHYIYFIYKKGSLNLFRAYNYFYTLNKILKKKKRKIELLMVFHNIEFLILISISVFLSFQIFFPIFLGVLIHYVLDFVTLLTCKEKKYKRAFSLIYYIIKNSKNNKNAPSH